jgi:hypothetical protein
MVPQIGFDEFLKIFNIKFADYEFKDVCNAFKLLAKDDDKWLPLDKIKKILSKKKTTNIVIIILIQILN